MTYEEFEWHILRMVYEEGVERLRPSYLAYALGLPHETVTDYLEHAVQAGLIELDVSEEGRLEYFVPGIDPARPLPRPVWKQDEQARQDEPTPASQALVRAEEHPITMRRAEAAQADAGGGADGSVQGDREPARVEVGHGRAQAMPPNLRTYIKEHHGETDGSLHRTVAARNAVIDRRAVVARGATVDEGPMTPAGVVAAAGGATTALVPYQGGGDLLRVESSEDAFCDPSQTIFMRQIRVQGVTSEAALREQIQRLFESFGYRSVSVGGERLRFERGSVTFILALVPLFVLILPLFIYLFLYCMGRSTIQQEPLELDVQIRRVAGAPASYDIDLTFIGLHGVVLGAADQRVLNQEIDTLRDELRWALAGS